MSLSLICGMKSVLKHQQTRAHSLYPKVPISSHSLFTTVLHCLTKINRRAGSSSNFLGGGLSYCSQSLLLASPRLPPPHSQPRTRYGTVRSYSVGRLHNISGLYHMAPPCRLKKDNKEKKKRGKKKREREKKRI